MLGHLIRKEILDHILSLRFLILSAVGALVIWLSLYSGHTYYRTWLAGYRVAQTASEERIRQIAAAGDHVYLPWEEVGSISYLVHKPPTPLSIFVRGLEPNLGQSIPVQGYRGNKRLKMSHVASEPILGVFPLLDLRLIVQVVLSLFVLLLTYDAVCGEKEAGTLRLAASFPVPKDRLLLGKLVGALIPSMMAFGVPLLLGIAVVLLLPDVAFTDPELVRLGWILVVFVVYLMVFTCVGLFASSVTHRVVTSFVILLAFWTASDEKRDHSTGRHRSGPAAEVQVGLRPTPGAGSCVVLQGEHASPFERSLPGKVWGAEMGCVRYAPVLIPGYLAGRGGAIGPGRCRDSGALGTVFLCGRLCSDVAI